MRVPGAALDHALNNLAGDLRDALEIAVDQVRGVARAEGGARTVDAPASRGIRARVVHTPLNRVLLYVPAGRAPLPSSVVMGVVPAQVAGVRSIGILTPPRRDGSGDPTTLAAAALLGIDEVHLVGGPPAIGAAAYGTATIERADKVVGPGNRWVTEAKRQVVGTIGIDGLNGPSEVVIWGEEPADPAQVAVDLLAQAEHDPASWAVVVSTNGTWLGRVEAEVSRLAAEEDRADLLEQRGVGAALVPGPDAAAAFVNSFCPEHAELWGAAEAYESRVTGAGALFVGAPVPLGDYAAGSNHVLPTGGTARFGSVLGVDDFLRRRTVTFADRGSRLVASAAARLAAAEGLDMHRRAAERFRQAEEVMANGGR